MHLLERHGIVVSFAEMHVVAVQYAKQHMPSCSCRKEDILLQLRLIDSVPK